MSNETIRRLVDDIADAQLVLYIKGQTLLVKPLSRNVPKPSEELVRRIQASRDQLIAYMRGVTSFDTPCIGSSGPDFQVNTPYSEVTLTQ